MGIYIKGMEMPKDHVRVLVLHPDGRVIDEWGNAYQVSLLQPHGRLIDADLFVEKCETAAKLKPYLECGLNVAESFAMLAPTIIPADGNMDTDFWGEEYAEAKGLAEEGE